MAESRERFDQGGRFDRQRAVLLIEEATRFLREYSGSSDIITTSSDTCNSIFVTQNTARNHDDNHRCSLSRGNTVNGRALENFPMVAKGHCQQAHHQACSHHPLQPVNEGNGTQHFFLKRDVDAQIFLLGREKPNGSPQQIFKDPTSTGWLRP